MLRKISFLLTIVTMIVTLTSIAFGQVTAGAVTGTVLDPNGAVVPNATVTLRSETTGQTFSAQASSSGSYNFPNVPAGNYTLNIESSGFQPATQTLAVSLNQTTTVDATLQTTGVAGTTIEVTAASEALVQSDTSQLGKSFQTAQVENLPIFGNQNALALLSPNVVLQSAGTAGSGGSVGGTRPRSNVFTIDGVDNNDPSVTGPATSVIQDAVGEFTLLTNNFNAEFGQGGGGQFVTITKSGTNEFHGVGFLYTQNQRLNAASTGEEALLRRPVAQGGIVEKPRLRDTRYGFTLGGPIVKNKLFFFGALQREPISQEGTSTTFLAPTAAGLAQLGGLPGASPFAINLLRNNLTLAQNGSILSGMTLDSRGRIRVPVTNSLGVAGVPFGEVSVSTPTSSGDNQFQINIDQLRGTKDQFRYRFSFDRFGAIQAGNGNTIFNNLNTFNSRLFSATYVRTFNSNLVNELRLSYKRTINDSPLQNPALSNFPNLTVGSLNLTLGPNENLPQGGFDNNYQVFDTVNVIRGKSNFKFGGEYRNLIFTSTFLPRGRGDYSYANFSELLQDRAPSNVDIRGVGSGGFSGNQRRFYGFAQDDYKVTPNLTLNLGVRYEYVGLPRDAKLQALNSISSVPGLFNFRVPKVDKNNFAPRVGFAYSPNYESGILGRVFGGRGKSAIRANFSESFSEVFQNLVLLQLPPQFQQELDVATANAAFGLNLNQNFLQQGGVPARPIPPTTVADARAGTGSLIEDQRLGETYAFALSFQRELTPTTAVEFRYLGTRSRHLPVQSRLNQPVVPNDLLTIPTFIGQTPAAAQLAGLRTLGSRLNDPRAFASPGDAAGIGGFVTAFEPEGSSNYDSAAVSVTRRFSRGLALTSAYTFSKTIDNSTNELFTSRVNPRRPQDARNLRNERGLSALDIPHRFVISANYEMPFFRKSSNSFVRNVLGGFTFAPIFQAQSGQPFTPNNNVDANLTFDTAGDRTILNLGGTAGTGSGVVGLDRNGNVVLGANGAPATLTFGNLFGGVLDNVVAYRAVNPNAQFIQTGFFARSTSGRNNIRSRGFNRTDLTVLKDFSFGGDRNYRFQAGAEVFNLLNQRIRTISGVGATTSAFANVDSSFFNNYSLGNFSGRTVQLRAKFIF